ncbi:MAG: hypothetical protein KAT06_13110 [Gammaproteobacteria bacterium]|nr:hypothetical protein [Gammaproteobacteria bacterium]
MTSYSVYIFHFSKNGDVHRIAYAKWKRLYSRKECDKSLANLSIYIAFAYIELNDRKAEFCPRIDGEIFYFDDKGWLILDKRVSLDIFQESREGIIDLSYWQKKKERQKKYYWTLNSNQNQRVIDLTWGINPK